MISPKKANATRIFLMPRIKAILTLIGLGIASAFMMGGEAQAAYPDKPIRLIIPFAAGGPSDVLGRSLGQRLSVLTGQPVLVENKPGAGTNLAADFVAKSPADGYTLLLMMVGTQAINEAMYPKLSYSTLKDFAPISLVASSSLALVANPELPAKNLKEVIAYAKANPGKLNYATSGAGTPLHMGGELLNNLAGIKIVHVPYKGAAPALNDVLGGQVQLAMVGTPSVLQYLKTGKLIGIGVTSLKRSPNAPEVPTIAETIPGYEVELVYAVVAPTGTPKPVITYLNSQLAKALENPEVKERLEGQGFDIRLSTPDQLGGYIRSELKKWEPIVKESGVKPE